MQLPESWLRAFCDPPIDSAALRELLTMAGQLRASEPEHAVMAVARVRAMGTMLDQAVERYRAGLAAGRTPARTCIDRSINQIDGYLRSPLDRDPFAAPVEEIGAVGVASTWVEGAAVYSR